MTTQTETNRSRFFVTSLLPWLVGGGMLMVYLFTLNHTPSTSNASRISELSGWYSPRHYFAPLTYLLTYPIRWLPAAFIGTALNLFTAISAALTLALLARSVSLLPHDRTHEQRLRELSEFSLLSIPTAWLPPLFAALVCGLEMSFWQNAVSTATPTANLIYFGVDSAGEMLDMLFFAYSIRCILEYRISLRNSWLARFAFVYGLGMANNWLIMGLFPGFLAAIVWIRGFSFFNARFLGLMSLCFVGGLSFILILPIVTAMQHFRGFGFWQVLHYVISNDKAAITSFSSETLLLLSLTSILPVFVLGIHWASYFGESSQIGIFLATFTFHIVHAVFLLACIWVAFDPPISPRQEGHDMPFLQLYYLGALSIGYFTGYFLLVFGVRPPKERQRIHPLIRFINLVVILAICSLAIGVPLFLTWINLPQIRCFEAADAAFDRLTSLTAGALPAEDAVVLGDDKLRLNLLQIQTSRGGIGQKNLLISTASLENDPSYIRSLEKRFPAFHLAGCLTNWNPRPPSLEMIQFLQKLNEHHKIYYIGPSFGEFFERFYMEPQGLVYQLKLYDTNTWKKPLLDSNQIAANQNVWQDVSRNELSVLTNLMDQPHKPIQSALLQYVMDTGHLSVETNKSAFMLGSDYSRALDYWGVELEKAGLLPEAGTRFAEAARLNPESISAQVNAKFNKKLRSGARIAIEQPAAVRDQFGNFRGWAELLNADGPFDDPSFCYVLGVALVAGENHRKGTPLPRRGAMYLQAIQQFERTHELAPDFPDAAYWLCQLFLRFGKDTNALAIAEQVLQKSPNDANALYYQAVALMQLGSFDKALPPLNHLLTLQTNNYSAKMERAISYLQLHDYGAAKTDYETLAQIAPRSYQIDYGLQEVAYQQKDTNAAVKYINLYLTNYYQSFPTNIPNFTPPESEEVKTMKQRLKELNNGAP